MKDLQQTYLNLPTLTKRMAKMGAARLGVTVSVYVARLIDSDCRATGIADLVVADQKGMKLLAQSDV